MKFLALLAAVLALFPASRALARRPAWLPWVLRALGPIAFLDVHVNLISYEQYRGDSRGIEITLFDLVIGLLALTIPAEPGAPPSLRAPRYAYWAAACLSVFVAPSALFGSFSVWKLTRMLFAFSIVERAVRRPALAAALCEGLAAAVIHQFLVSFGQRYLQGSMRVQGTLSHPNSLGMATNLLFPLSFALLLRGDGGRLAAAAVAAGALSVVMSLSRGAILMYAAAAALVYVGSLWRRFSARKAAILALGLLGVTGVLARSFDTLVERFTQAPASSEEARHRFEDAARLMLKEHPLGVGINQFSRVLDEGGYADRCDIPPIDRDGIVHNIYWLTAAEIGWVGILAFVWLLAAPLWRAARLGLSRGDDPRRDLALGLAAGLFVTYVQGKAEWIFRQTTVSYLFFTLAALIVALERQLAPRPAGRA